MHAWGCHDSPMTGHLGGSPEKTRAVGMPGNGVSDPNRQKGSHQTGIEGLGLDGVEPGTGS